MGLIHVAKDAFGGVLEDQYREFFVCDALPNNVLVRRGRKNTSRRSSNRGDDNIISNGSLVTVAPGQFMMITDQGRIVDFTDEPGAFLYDSGSEASLLYNAAQGLGDNIKRSFKNAIDRFTFGGHPGKEQRVYYVNIKPILGNRYGTPNPVPFRVVDERIGLDMIMPIRAHGEYTYKIVNPLLFYVNVCGNVSEDFTTDHLESQLKSELMTALQPALAKLSALKIGYDELPLHTMEMADALNEVLSAKWTELRGIAVDAFGVSSVSASDDDVARLQELQRAAVYKDARMAAAGLTAAQAEAMRSAAKNEATGAFVAFAGLNAVTQAGGANVGALFEQAARHEAALSASQSTPSEPAPPAAPTQANDTSGWICGVCGTGGHHGRFCSQCGHPKPPAAHFRCDKCGYEPDLRLERPKFCPNCGDPMNDDDIVT